MQILKVKVGDYKQKSSLDLGCSFLMNDEVVDAQNIISF